MRNRAVLIPLFLSLAACGQYAGFPAGSPSTPIQIQSVALGDTRVFIADGSRWWADGSRWWADGSRWWADGTRWWADGSRWWADGTFQPAPENSAAFKLIGLDRIQDLASKMGQGVIVAVIDTGVDFEHPMLKGALLPGHDYINNRQGAREEGGDHDLAYGHGSAVAGLIRQVAPAATILPMRVLSPDGSGLDKAVAQAIRDAAAQGARVINLSLGTSTSTGGVRDAIVSATEQGVIVLGASGNAGESKPQSPAWHMGNPDAAGRMSLSVGAVDQAGNAVSWSNAGSEVVAPGVNMTTAYPGQRLVNASGTSFSTPLVSGAVALALAEGANASRLSETLKSSSQQGRLDVANLMAQPK
ncbi:S8 family peptidase [Deinococcus peraridilitoris]|uniref:Subtilisin-like serine protease n=1 Tax=Deinococcus peraridilitoris (strain DSM 19664 / LMG 22246 / CIP 109416 / KR-200) TaxID=937777 RepID=L0A946_DEIPD|nr:S8 family serine peptidase [Deinococcus peraridilitoris]AFZ69580.1 subtilisin-like serine protease [Deinococcus peraridilitoris DSM 19664]